MRQVIPASIVSLPIAIFLTFRVPIATSLSLSAPAMTVFVITLVLCVTGFAILGRPRELAGAVAKALLLVACLALTGAFLVFRFGNPLAGIIYWVTTTTGLKVILPVVLVLVVVEFTKSKATAFAVSATVITVFVALLCAVNA